MEQIPTKRNQKKQIIFGTTVLVLILLIFVQPIESNSSTHLPLWEYIDYSSKGPVVISGDGQYIVANSGYNILLFHRNNFLPLWTCHISGSVNCFAISEGGDYFVGGLGYFPDGIVVLFHKDSSSPVWQFTTFGAVNTVGISADGQYIIAGTWNGTVFLFNRTSSTPLWNFTAKNPIEKVVISADGNFIAVGTWSSDLILAGTVYFFNRTNQVPLWNYTIEGSGHREIRDMDISMDGQRVTAISDNYNLYLFNITGPTPMHTHHISDSLYGVSIAAEGQVIAVQSSSKIFLFNGSSLEPIWNSTLGSGGLSISYPSRTLAISANAEIISVARMDELFTFNQNSSTPLWNYTTDGSVRWVGISADGQYIVSGSWGNLGHVYLFHSSQSGIIPQKIPFILILSSAILIFLVIIYILYYFMSKTNLTEEQKEGIVGGSLWLNAGILGFLYYFEIPYYDTTTISLSLIFSSIISLIGIILLFLGLMKIIPRKSTSSNEKTVAILFTIFGICFLILFLFVALNSNPFFISHSYFLIWGLYFQLILQWSMAGFNIWKYFKKKRKSQFDSAIDTEEDEVKTS